MVLFPHLASSHLILLLDYKPLVDTGPVQTTRAFLTVLSEGLARGGGQHLRVRIHPPVLRLLRRVDLKMRQAGHHIISVKHL